MGLRRRSAVALAQKKLDSLKTQYAEAVAERDHHQALIEPGDAAVTYANLTAEIGRWEAVVVALKTVLDTVVGPETEKEKE